MSSPGTLGDDPQAGTLGLQREGLKRPADAGRAPGLKAESGINVRIEEGTMQKGPPLPGWGVSTLVLLTFGAGSFSAVGAVACVVGRSAASLTSIHQMPVAHPL